MASLKMDPQVMELFKDPKKCYSTFSQAVVQDAEANKLDAIIAKLLCFNEVLIGNTISKDTLTQVIDEIVCLGMVEMVFVKMINQPVSATLTKALMILLEALCNVIEYSNTAKSKSRIFLPYLVRNMVGKAENGCRLRIEAAKLINTLLEEKDSKSDDLISNIKKQKTIRDDIGTLLTGADDYELQALVVELVFRLIPPSERASYISTWFSSPELRQLFTSIVDTSFEPGCRTFLNKLNSAKPDSQKRVYSIPCQRIFFGNEKIYVAKDTDSNNYWIDFNLGSKALKFFVEERDDKDADETWWHTVVIGADNVSSCLFMEPHRNGPTIKIVLKEDTAKLIPSLTERGDHSVFIRLGVDSHCDQQMLSDILHKMTWMRADYLSPSKASVAINVVRVGSRQRGVIEVIPSVSPMPPEELMQGDSVGDREDPMQHDDSDYPPSLTGLSQETTTTSQPTSLSSQKQDSQDIEQGQQNQGDKRNTTEEDKQDKREPPREDNSPSQRVLRSNTRTEPSEKTSTIENSNHDGPSTPKDDGKTNTKLANRPKEKPRDLSNNEKNTEKKVVSSEKENNVRKSQDKSGEMDNRADSSSSSSRQSSRGGRATPKRTKSPLPVEVKKGKQSRTSTSTSSSTDDERSSINRTHGGTKKSLKSSFDIAKETHKLTKTYPNAFNVAKRMEAKKNNASTILSRSKELTNKVFGQKGISFSQKTSHITKPKPFQSNSPPSKEALSKDNDIRKDVSTNSEPISLDREEEQIEVIQDSLPLEDSPEKVPRRRPDFPKPPDRAILEKRLVKSTQPAKRTKKKATPLEHVPTRLGSMLRKGGPSTRSSFLKKDNSGWGSSTSSSTTSTSDTDWPGPNVEPGPKAKHSLVPHISIRERRGARTKAAQLARVAKRKRASISPGLSAISEEKSPTAIDEEQEPVGDKQMQNETARDIDNQPMHGEDQENNIVEPEQLVDDGPNGAPKHQQSKDTRHSKPPVKGPSKEPNNTPNPTDRDEQLDMDLPNLVLQVSPEDTNSSGGKLGDKEKDDDTIDMLPSHNTHKRKAQEDDDDGDDEAKDAENGFRDEKARKRKAQEDDDDDYEAAKQPTKDVVKSHHIIQNEKSRKRKAQEHGDGDYEAAKQPTSKDIVTNHHLIQNEKVRKTKFKEQPSKRDLFEWESEDDLDNEYTAPKKLKTFSTTHTAKSYADKTKKDNKDTRAEEDPVEDMSPGYDALEDFDALENVGKKSKKVNTTKTMLKPARAVGKHNKAEKRTTKSTGYKEREKSTKEHKKTPLPNTVEHDRTSLQSINRHKKTPLPSTVDHGKTSLQSINRYKKTPLQNTVDHDKTPLQSINRHKKTPLASSSSKKSIQKDMEHHECEDFETTKLRQFCQNIADGYSSTPKPRKPSDKIQESRKPKRNVKESNQELDDSDEELSGYSEEQTMPTKRLDEDGQDEIAAGKKRTSNTGHEAPRHHPCVTHVTTNERFGRLQSINPSKWKTPSNKHSRLDDSGIGETPASNGLPSGRSISTASAKTNQDHTHKGRRKGELLITKAISKTPVTPRTSAIIRRIDEEQSTDQHVEKHRRKLNKTVDWTSSGPSKESHYKYDDDDNDEIDEDDDDDQAYIKRVQERPKAKAKVDHNPNIRPRKLFKDREQNAFDEEFEDDNEPYRSSDDSVITDITHIMTDLQGTLTDRLRRKRNHLQHFCKKTFDVTLDTLNKHLEQSLSNRDELVDSFNDQFLDEMNTLKDEIDKSKKNEDEIMSRIQDDIRVLKTHRVIQENKIKSLKKMCVEFQSELIKDNDLHPESQGSLHDDIREELLNIQRNFMKEVQSQDRENLRRSLRSVLDVTMM